MLLLCEISDVLSNSTLGPETTTLLEDEKDVTEGQDLVTTESSSQWSTTKVRDDGSDLLSGGEGFQTQTTKSIFYLFLLAVKSNIIIAIRK